MAKAILEYDLNDQDDKRAHLRAIKSLDMALVLCQIAHNTKKGLYNEVEFNKLDAYEIIDKFYEGFWQEMDDHGINLDELVV